MVVRGTLIAESPGRCSDRRDALDGVDNAPGRATARTQRSPDFEWCGLRADLLQDERKHDAGHQERRRSVCDVQFDRPSNFNPDFVDDPVVAISCNPLLMNRCIALRANGEMLTTGRACPCPPTPIPGIARPIIPAAHVTN